MPDIYAKAGVNIDKGNEVVRRIKKSVASTHNKAVLKNIGSFGGLFDLGEILKKYKNPVLVQSIDGVGTKLTVAKMVGKYQSVGEDIVGHSCGDIVAMGARPITFLDYVANEKLEPKVMEEMVFGMAKACREAGVAIVGGETAEMPGVYAKGEHDIAGCITGIVEKDKIITGEHIKNGDIILGLSANGLNTNGFSLARKILFKDRKYTVKTKPKELGETIGEALLKVHTNYAPTVLKLLDKGVNIKGIAHITGGGLVENPPRVLPKNLDAEIDKGSWSMPPIFPYLQKLGKIPEKEMYKAFNMGVGMIIIISPKEKARVENLLSDEQIFWVGRIIKGTGRTVFK